MKTITVVVTAVTILSGCESMPPLFVAKIAKDVSTGAKTAQIHSPNGNYCTIYSPAKGHLLTVNAGPVLIVQKCWQGDSLLNEATDGLFGEKGKDSVRAFYFVAQPGRRYEIARGCVLLQDDDGEVESQIVTCAPRMTGRMEDNWLHTHDACSAKFALLRKNDPSINSRKDAFTGWKSEPGDEQCLSESQGAVIISGGTTPRQDTCWPSVEPKWSAFSLKNLNYSRVVFSGIDASPTRLDASCDSPTQDSGYTVRTASFDFDAEPGHIYTLSGEDEDCMRLLDITSEKTVIACEPYRKKAD